MEEARGDVRRRTADVKCVGLDKWIEAWTQIKG
jgi:hypothetical protein